MIIGLIILFTILGCIFLGIACISYDAETAGATATIISWILASIIFIFGCFHGFINHPKTEGMHQGVLTAVDLEGVYFRRYECYLKSGEYTGQSDESKYLLYENETELVDQLKNAIGKKVKIYYGHDGGYIGWNSCGTYHIKRIEIVEE